MNSWLVRFLLGCVAAMFATSAALAQTKTQQLAIVGRERGLSPLSSTIKDELEKNGVKIDDGLVPDEFDAPLLAAHDTVVFSQICSIGKDLSPEMKQALLKWVAEGHKFILHDADNCWGEKKPDYSFLPFNFETDSPGGHAAPGDELFFVENNTLGTSDPRDKTHFVDLAKWVEGNEGNNELGDSNIVTTQSKDWCGHMFGTNVQGASGFSHMYAHLGKGLVIYNGFDLDQSGNAPSYDRIVRLEIEQPFNPDNLACTMKVAAGFLVTSEPKTQTQQMATGKTFTFPLKLYSNSGYKGNVRLALEVSPPERGLSETFSPASVPLETKAKDTLTVKAAPSARMQTYTLKVTGTDEHGMQNSTLLALLAPEPEKKNGTLLIIPPKTLAVAPAKNIEIILDASGSMKEMIGGGASKIQIARQMLTDVLAKLPDDTNVGLRVYGHRLSSKDPNTCTDSELVVPLEKLDREKIATVVNKINPRGETPLVYSILKAPEDFSETKGGVIILITDGQESCKGDTKTVGARLKAAGVDFKLSIVGFGITQKPVQKELQAMAGSTGGQYFTATNSDALGAALLKVAAEKKTFVLLDAAGSEVARGVVGEALTITPGTYKVTVLAEEPVSLDNVRVDPGQAVQLKLLQTGEKWELQP
jgi:hypothetical protein